MEMIDKITKRVYLQDNEGFVAKRDGELECIFTIHPFNNRYMAYVTVKAVSGKQKLEREGNSLWGCEAQEINELREKINSYHSYSQIKKDYMII